MNDQLKLFYYRSKDGKLNFGDELSKDIVQFVSGKRVVKSSRMGCDVTAIGSILDRYFRPQSQIMSFVRKKIGKEIVVWGSGFIKERSKTNHFFNISAVRGKHTRDILGCDGRTVLGDPALIISSMIRAPKKRRGIGIVPHFTDKNHRLVNELAKQKGVKIIDVERAGPEVCAEIAGCSVIFSSSLHGLIVADAFSIPNYRLALNGHIIGGSFKFFDYASAINRENIEVLQILDPEQIKSLAYMDYDHAYFENIDCVCTDLEAALKNNV